MRSLQGRSDDPKGFGSLAVSRVFLFKFFVSFRIHYKWHNYISFSSLIEHISCTWWFTTWLQGEAEQTTCASAPLPLCRATLHPHPRQAACPCQTQLVPGSEPSQPHKSLRTGRASEAGKTEWWRKWSPCGGLEILKEDILWAGCHQEIQLGHCSQPWTSYLHAITAILCLKTNIW